MLSAIVLSDAQGKPLRRDLRARSRDADEVLVRTLASLVAPTIAGIIGDVVIAGAPSRDLETIADHAGCGFVAAEGEDERLRRAIEAARRPQLLILRSGRVPEAGFIEEAEDFLALQKGEPLPPALLRAVPENFFQRLFPSRAPIAGLLASREICLLAPRGGLYELARFTRAKITLRTRARRTD
jgi:hypothetical protein